MKKIFLIIRREYFTRVRKKTFIIMTILGPVLFGALMVVPIWLTMREDTEVKKIAVVEYNEFNEPVPDSLLFFKDVITNKKNLKFDYLSNIEFNEIERLLINTDYDGFLVLRQNLITQSNGVVELFAKDQPGLYIEQYISKSLQTFLYQNKLLRIHLSPKTISALETNISLKTIKLENGSFREEKLVDLKRGVGYAGGFLIYFFIFLFGAQVMRGVIEEKTNRIIEVIITSVRPFELMMGKIIGIALVGLTQFLMWVFLTAGIYHYTANYYLKDQLKKQTEQVAPKDMFAHDVAADAQSQTNGPQVDFKNIFDYVHDLDLIVILSVFLFYFLFGYLLYASMFAAIGSAADSETDTQQFMLPVTIPLIVGIMVMMNAILNPSGQLAYWFSIIPFTSPIVMMARIPFHVPISELILSMSLLVITFVIMTWLAGKIYRIGILMYGKKVSYKEIFKWLTYKE
jgi:ABC-2 type transport system permease protein